MREPLVETYRLYAANGRYIRQATRVTLEDGSVCKFIDKLGKREAIKAARLWRETGMLNSEMGHAVLVNGAVRRLTNA